MVRVLDSGSTGPGSGTSCPGTSCCVLGQDTLTSQCLSPPRCIYGSLEVGMLVVTLRWSSIPSKGE